MLRALLVACLATTNVHAESWYDGPRGRDRVRHVWLTGVGFTMFLATKPLEAAEASTTCTWCNPTSLDVSVRNALVWSDRRTPGYLSDVTSYVISPVLAIGLVAAGTFADESPTLAQQIDDFTPIAEALMFTQWATRALKMPIARQRPYAHYTAPHNYEDNLSFPSGHTSHAFALVTSAAMIARKRGYRSEPYIWALGLTAASSSAFLRIAADKHYLTDVLAGAAIGTAFGLTVPSLSSWNSITIVPERDGVAIAGAW